MTDFDAPHKERLVKAFLRGESVTDLSAFYAVKRGTVEDVLRESILGLAALNKTLYKELHPVEIAPLDEKYNGEPLHIVPASMSGD